MNLKKMKAFTVVEVLVVIAILALLTAFTIPFAVKDRNRVRFQTGDKIVIKTLGLRGVVDYTEFGRATVIVVGHDGYPTKMTVDVRVLEKE